MIVYYSEYSMSVVGDDVPKWLPKWASQLKTIMSDLRLRNGNFPFQNRKGCELGLYISINHIHTLFYKRVYLQVLHIPLIMYYICIIRGSSLIKLGSLQDNRNYITERSVRWYYGFSIAAAAAARRPWRREHSNSNFFQILYMGRYPPEVLCYWNLIPSED